MDSKFEINMPMHPGNEISGLSLVLQLSGHNLLPMYKKIKQPPVTRFSASHKHEKNVAKKTLPG
jgi:hypothetical protein